jgi:hypothetical protein
MDIRIQFHQTPEDVRIGVRQYWRHCYVSKRELYITVFFLFLLVMFSIIKGGNAWLCSLIYGFCGLSFWIVRFRTYFFLLRRKIKECNVLSIGTGELQLTLNDTTILLAGGQTCLEWKWGQLKRVIEYKNVLLLCWDKFDFLIIPLNQISPNALSEIRNTTKQA